MTEKQKQSRLRDCLLDLKGGQIAARFVGHLPETQLSSEPCHVASFFQVQVGGKVLLRSIEEYLQNSV